MLLFLCLKLLLPLAQDIVNSSLCIGCRLFCLRCFLLVGFTWLVGRLTAFEPLPLATRHLLHITVLRLLLGFGDLLSLLFLLLRGLLPPLQLFTSLEERFLIFHTEVDDQATVLASDLHVVQVANGK